MYRKLKTGELFARIDLVTDRDFSRIVIEAEMPDHAARSGITEISGARIERQETAGAFAKISNIPRLRAFPRILQPAIHCRNIVPPRTDMPHVISRLSEGGSRIGPLPQIDDYRLTIQINTEMTDVVVRVMIDLRVVAAGDCAQHQPGTGSFIGASNHHLHVGQPYAFLAGSCRRFPVFRCPEKQSGQMNEELAGVIIAPPATARIGQLVPSRTVDIVTDEAR